MGILRKHALAEFFPCAIDFSEQLGENEFLAGTPVLTVTDVSGKDVTAEFVSDPPDVKITSGDTAVEFSLIARKAVGEQKAGNYVVLAECDTDQNEHLTHDWTVVINDDGVPVAAQ